MRHTMLCLITLPLLLDAASAHAQGIDASKQYQTCTELTRSDPSQALRMASEWARKENTASANHCLAISLFALKRYKDAAEALERLSFMITEQNLMLWANVLRQASKSWQLSGDNSRAIVALSKAIYPASDNAMNDASMARLAADLLLERSTLYVSVGRDLYAIQDLDQAVMLAPTYDKPLLARAEIFIRRKNYSLARQDLDRVLAKQPTHPQATQLANQLKEKSGS